MGGAWWVEGGEGGKEGNDEAGLAVKTEVKGFKAFRRGDGFTEKAEMSRRDTRQGSQVEREVQLRATRVQITIIAFSRERTVTNRNSRLNLKPSGAN